ncbi:MAG: WXG100 family type VII secretion target, partial [Chloroflexales bacterium]|nr:WXG100 family type VII secretion target [Chloroflexales bacterium]
GVQALADGGWEGAGSAAFLAEMQGEIFPALQRFRQALEEARAVTLEAKIILQQAEEEAARVFQGDVLGVSDGAGNGFSPLSPWVSAPFAAGASVLGTVDGFAPLSPWMSAPFAAGASVFGPGPAPIFGRGGRVPAGYTNAGKRLWLYIGGSGPDTMFSIHPHAGWGRAPWKLPKPNLRFDYGIINTKLGQGFTPRGLGVPVPAGPNFFHWNVQGNMGQINTPLFRSFDGPILKDHQLLTNNPNPRGNVIGRIPGGSLIRGASRGLFVVGAGLDVYNIATADDKVKESVKVASGWGGAWAGAKGGAAVGATIGSFFGPGPGTAIGGVVGGVFGGIGGYLAGSSVGEAVYDLFD